MRIAVMGAGGIGGFYGALLARAGHEVILIARGEHLEAIRRDGLTVIGDQETFTVRPALATGDPAEAGRDGPAELVLVTTKAYDLDGAARALRPLVGPETLVLPLLNGIGIHQRISAILPEAQVLAGLTYLPAHRPAPGQVRHQGEQRQMVFGEPGGDPGPGCQALLEMLQAAGINAELSPDMPYEIWRKFMMVNANGGICCVTGEAVAAVLSDPDTRALFAASCREVTRLAAKLDIVLEPALIDEILAMGQALPPDVKPSMLHDLEAGRPLELDTHAGAVTRMGTEMGVPVPVNAMVHAALKHRAGGKNNHLSGFTPQTPRQTFEKV